MHTDQQPKLRVSPSISVPPSISAPPSIVIVESGAPGAPTASVAPRSMRSLQPLAASLRPGSSLSPSMGSAARGRWIRVGAMVSVAALGFGALLVHGRARTPAKREIVAGRATPRATPTGASEHWTGGPAFVLDSSLDRMDPGAKGAIIDAFSTWDSAGLGLPRASFSIASTPCAPKQNGVSEVVYAPIEVPGKEDALAITVTYADASSGAIGETDVIFNSKYKFDVFKSSGDEGEGRCNGHYDVQNVATHEAGHVYGLGEDMSDHTTTMFVTSDPCETHKRALSAPDLGVMTALYEAAPAAASAAASASATQAAGCGGATVASRGPASGGGATWAVVMGFASIVLRRRQRRRG